MTSRKERNKGLLNWKIKKAREGLGILESHQLMGNGEKGWKTTMGKIIKNGLCKWVVNLSRAFCDPCPRSYQNMSAASSKLLK